MNSATPSPLDFIKPYKDAGVSALVWITPGESGNLNSESLANKLGQKSVKTEILPIPEPPPGYPVPPRYPELTLTILDPSTVEVVLSVASDHLKESFQNTSTVTVKIDVVLDERLVSVEANGDPSDVGKTIKGIPKIEKLASSNLAAIVTQHGFDKSPTMHFCSKCGAAISPQSEFCYKCGERQGL